MKRPVFLLMLCFLGAGYFSIQKSVAQSAYNAHNGVFEAQPAASKNATTSSANLRVPASAQLVHLNTATLFDYAKTQTDKNPNAAFPLTIKTAQQEWSFALTQNDLRSATYKLRTSTGEAFEGGLSAVQTYKGILQNRPDTQVRLTVNKGYFKGMVVDEAGEKYYLESIDPSLTSNKAGNGESTLLAIFSEHEDVSPLSECDAEVHATHNGETSTTSYTNNKSSQPVYIAEIALIVDYRAYAKATSLQGLEEQLIATLNYTDGYYDTHQINYTLTEIYVSTDAATQPWPERTNAAGDMLTEINNWAANGGMGHHDIGTFWTGIDFGYSYSWVDVIGTRYKQHLNEYFEAGYERWAANMQAHEAGHSWGAPHVEHSQQLIMSPVIYNGELNWSQATQSRFPGYVQKAMPHLDEDDGNPQPAALFSQLSVMEDDNLDGVINPGETATVDVQLANTGNAPLEQITVTLSAGNAETDQWVTINSAPIQIQQVDAGNSVSVRQEIALSSETPGNSELALRYQISSATFNTESTLTLEAGEDPNNIVLAAELNQLSVLGDDNQDGIINPGETALVDVLLSNTGNTVLEQLTVTLTAGNDQTAQWITVNSAPMLVERVEADNSVWVRQEITLNSETPSRSQLALNYEVTSDAYNTEATLTLEAGDDPNSTILAAELKQLSILGDDNEDGSINPGETALIDVLLSNTGNTALEQLTVTLTAGNDQTGQWLTINSNPVVVERIEADNSVWVRQEVTLSESTPGESELALRYQVSSATYNTESTLTIEAGESTNNTVLAAELDQLSVLGDDNQDGSINPGETALIDVLLSNTGNTALEQLTVTLSAGNDQTNEWITINSAPVQVERIEADNSVWVRQEIMLSNATPGNSELALRYQVSSAAYSTEATLPLEAGEGSTVSNETPDEFTVSLASNYPNPFTENTIFTFTTDGFEPVRLSIFDTLGREIAVLVHTSLPAGEHQYTWRPSQIASGTYITKLQAGSKVFTQMVLYNR